MLKKNKRKAIVLIAVGDLSLNQILWARELGLTTIVTDQNPNARSLSVADIPIIADGKDFKKIAKNIKRLEKQYEIIGAYTNLELAETIASLGNLLKVPSINIKAANEIEDKINMKKRLVKNNIPTAKFSYAKSKAELVKKVKTLGLPIVIKPPNSSGSRGVTVISDLSELSAAYREAKKFSKGTIIMEKFLKGSMHDVNGIIFNGKFHKAGILDRLPNLLPYTFPVGTIDPSRLNKRHQEECYKITEKAANAFGITFGPFKADLVLTQDGPKVLEVAPRFHGDITTSLTTPYATGMNPLKAYFKLLVTGVLDERLLLPKKNLVAGFKVIMAQPGILKSIKNLEKAKSIKGVLDILLRKNVGDKVSIYKNNNDVVGFIIAVSKTGYELKKLFETVEHTLKIRTDS